MKKSLAAVVLTLGLASVAHAFTMPTGDATAGQTKAAACGACHGADGNSVAPTFPRLAGQNAKYIFKQLSDFKAGRRINGTMQGMAAGLSEQDMADVAAYFSSQKNGVDLAKAALVHDGETLYRGGNAKVGLAPCSGCHGPAGKGNEFAAFPHIGGQHSDYLKKQLYAFRAAGRGDITTDDMKRVNDPNNMMEMIAAKLSDQDIEDLSSYISGLH